MANKRINQLAVLSAAGGDRTFLIPIFDGGDGQTKAIAVGDLRASVLDGLTAADAGAQPSSDALTALSSRGIGVAEETDLLDRAAADARYATPASVSSMPGTVRILGQQHTPVSKTDADTSEAALYSLLIPAGTIGPNDTLRITPFISYSPNTVSKVVRWRIGGVQLVSQNISGATLVSFPPFWRMSCRNSLTSQIASVDLSTGIAALAVPFTFTSIDFSVDQTLTFTGQHGTAGSGSNSITLQSVFVEHIRGV